MTLYLSPKIIFTSLITNFIPSEKLGYKWLSAISVYQIHLQKELTSSKGKSKTRVSETTALLEQTLPKKKNTYLDMKIYHAYINKGGELFKAPFYDYRKESISIKYSITTEETNTKNNLTK